MARVVRILFDLIIYIAIVLVILFGLPRALSWALDTPYPMAAITSGSMWPALNEGDLVFIQNVPKEELEVGDIIVFRNLNGGTFTIHRIIELRSDDLITQGDANFDPDEPTAYENVVGRSFRLFGRVMRVPHLGSVTVVASNFRE